MIAILKKELRTMLSSLSLMLALAAYFILVGLWLWFFPQTSIPDNKFATLQTLFEIAPWLFLFIIPAFTMRSVSEEKNTGTLDILRTKPITMWQLISGKFTAILILIFIMILISQVYTLSVYQLGFPKGNLDLGGTAGSFLGWIFLAGCYIAIGIFASAISNSQMIAFLSAAFGCFLFYNGPAFIATLPVFVGNLDYYIQRAGIQWHYQSMSKGVLIAGDLVYFIAITLLFLLLASRVLNHSGSQSIFSRRGILRNKRIVLVAVLLGVAAFMNFSIDLTEDKRYTLSAETKSQVKGVDDIIYAELLFEGKLPAAFTRLKKSAVDKLKEFNQLNNNIRYELIDPLNGNPEDVIANQEALRKDGILPTQLTVYNGKTQEQKIIYPYVVFHFGERTIPVNLLETRDPNLTEDEILNKSVALLEYKFGNAIQKLRMKKNPVVVFTKGHDELTVNQTADLERTLRPVFQTGRISLDSVIQISPEIDVLIVAKPQRPFSTRDNFLLDQYVMNGGKVIWFIDPVYVNTDTVNAANRLKQDFIPLPYDLNLDELFFKYGFRIQNNMVLDYECTTIPLFTGTSGGAPQFEPKPWYYHPLIAADSKHPIVKGLDRISTFYPATVDTLKTKTEVFKTILLNTSAHSRTVTSPSPINFEMVRQPLSPEQFNRDQQPIAVLLEGIFASAFENRVTTDFAKALNQINTTFKSESTPTKMIVFSDGDLPANAFSNRSEPAPLGFNIYEQRTYPANKNLVLNSIEFLIDDKNIMNARSKEIKLRLLDEARLEQNKSAWQWMNLLVPAFISLLLFWVTDLWRKRKYARA